MHTITQREFRLEDFSIEHLETIARFDDDNEPHQPYMIIKAVIDCLNACRKTYLETKSKTDWWQMIQLLPSSYNQTRNITLSYEAAANIYRQRKYHKLDEWREFCSFLETLPYPEFIIGKDCTTTVLCGDDKQTVVTQSADEIRIGTIPANKIKVHDVLL